MSTVEARTLLSLLIIFAVGQVSTNSAFEGNETSAVQNVLGLKQGCRFCKLMSQLVRGRFRPSKTPKHCPMTEEAQCCASLVGAAREECESAAKSTTTKKETASLCRVGPFCKHFSNTEEGTLDQNELVERICSSCKSVARCYLTNAETTVDLSAARSIIHSFCRTITFWQRPGKCVDDILESIAQQTNDPKQIILNPKRICLWHGSCASTQGKSTFQELSGDKKTTSVVAL